jgi:thiamine-monophosphate kinase
LLGGDTVSTPGPVMISITAFGRVPPGRMVRRDALRAGDHVFVSGTIGDAALGLDLLKGKTPDLAPDHSAFLIGRYRVPQPRLALARAVRDHAGAAMDVSDGLAGDLAKMCAASGVTATIDAGAVPLSQAARAMLATGAVGLQRVLGGGDDYEILCGVSPDRRDGFVEAATRAGVDVTAIGRAAAGTGLPRFVDPDGAEITISARSFSHF